MHAPRTLLLGLMLALAAPAAAKPRGYNIPPGPPLPYEIRASNGAHYQIGCRFRAVRVTGAFDLDRGLVNFLDLSGRGPEIGTLPADNGRCTVKLLKGKGPVTLILRKDKTYTATVQRVGQTAKLFVY